MDFVTQCRLPFGRVVNALEVSLRQRGFTARRSFDLPRAVVDPPDGVNYSVLMIDTAASGGAPHIILAHESAGRLVLTLASSSSDAETHDLRAALAEILVELGCWSWEEAVTGGRVIDPVCGRSLDPEDAHAVVERDGRKAHLCCALCQSTFEREPERYP